MCGCSSSSGNSCNCGCENYTLSQIAGPTGATGPAGTTVLYWNPDTLSTATTGSDVLLATYTLPAATLDTAGDELEFVITGAWLLDAVRYVKVELNNPITTVAQCSGILSNGVFVIQGIITYVSNTSTEGWNQSVWNNGATTQQIVSNGFVTDFTGSQTFKVYVNQDVATSVRIDSIKIKKANI